MTRLATLADVPHLEQAIRQAGSIAVDTEFHAERRYLPALFLVQLRLPDGETWIVDPLIDGLLAGLAGALRATDWILHGGAWDMQVLQAALGGLPDHVWDTQIAAGLVQPWFPLGYASLTEELLGQRVDKSATLSDWSRRPLSAEQLDYAAADVALLFDLWAALIDRLGAADRVELAQQACDEARAQAIDPSPADEAWRQLRGRSSLSGQQLAVLQEIAAWRRERAVAQNQPERSILGDGAVLELAKRQPSSRSALTANRRLPRALHKNADELLERMGRAARRPEWAWPRTAGRRTPQWQVLSWLEVWAMALGCRESFAGALVFPVDLLEDVVLADDVADALSRLSPWRSALAGEALRQALSGDAGLVVQDGTLCLTAE